MEVHDEIILDVAEFFKVFGEPSRIRILYALTEREMGVGELVEAVGMSQPSVSHQLRVLRQNGLVKYRKDKKSVIYSLDDKHVETLLKQGLEHVKHKNNYHAHNEEDAE